MKKVSNIKVLGVFELLIYGCLFLSQGCSHKSIAPKTDLPASPAPVPILTKFENPVVLKLNGEKGRGELSVNCALTTTHLSTDGDLRRQVTEALDFKIKSTITEVLPNGEFKEILEVVSKEGNGSLHDFAYPDLDEKLEMEYLPNGKVLKAGNYPKDSIFYVPALPLPTKPVSPGDQWTNVNKWKSHTDKALLTITLHSTYKENKQCGEHLCASIEVSGVVSLTSKLQKKNGFSHKLNGRFLFEPVRGLLVWSDFSTYEQMQGKANQVVLRSDLRSELAEPLGYRTKDHGEPSCPYETKE